MYFDGRLWCFGSSVVGIGSRALTPERWSADHNGFPNFMFISSGDLKGSQMSQFHDASIPDLLDKIHIRNLGFEKFLKETVIPAACNDLGVHRHITNPIAELHTMFLCTSGSQ